MNTNKNRFLRIASNLIAFFLVAGFTARATPGFTPTRSDTLTHTNSGKTASTGTAKTDPKPGRLSTPTQTGGLTVATSTTEWWSVTRGNQLMEAAAWNPTSESWAGTTQFHGPFSTLTYTGKTFWFIRTRG